MITAESRLMLDKVAEHRAELQAVLDRYDAYDLQVFGSVARGEAKAQSDIDFMVRLRNPEHRFLMRMGGINELFRQILGRDVDVVVPEFLREGVSATALEDCVPV